MFIGWRYEASTNPEVLLSHKVRILQNELRVENVLFQEVTKFLTSKNVFYIKNLLKNVKDVFRRLKFSKFSIFEEQ